MNTLVPEGLHVLPKEKSDVRFRPTEAGRTCVPFESRLWLNSPINMIVTIRGPLSQLSTENGGYPQSYPQFPTYQSVYTTGQNESK